MGLKGPGKGRRSFGQRVQRVVHGGQRGAEQRRGIGRRATGRLAHRAIEGRCRIRERGRRGLRAIVGSRQRVQGRRGRPGPLVQGVGQSLQGGALAAAGGKGARRRAHGGRQLAALLHGGASLGQRRLNASLGLAEGGSEARGGRGGVVRRLGDVVETGGDGRQREGGEVAQGLLHGRRGLPHLA